MTPGMSLKQWDKLGQLSRELEILKELSQGEHKIYIYSYGKDDEKYINDPNIQVLSRYRLIPFGFKSRILQGIMYSVYNIISLILRWSIFKKVSLIKTNQYKGSFFGVILKLIFKQKLIVRMGYYYCHFKKTNWIERYLQQIIFMMADSILVTTQEAQRFIREEYHLESKKVIHLYNYINTDKFMRLEKPFEYDLLYIGRLNNRKNVMNLIFAIEELKLKLLIIGNGPLKDVLREYSDRKNLSTTILDNINNELLLDYYNKSKIFILPSYYEGNPKVLLEAMACGSLVIATDVPGINNIVKNGRNGILCNTDVNSIKSKIEYCLKNLDDLNDLRLNARRYVVENCDLHRKIKEEIKIIESFNNLEIKEAK